MHKFEDNFDIKSKNGYDVYTLKKDINMELKFKTVENQGKVSVYINYQERNPLSSMLLGNFQAECDMSSIEFTVEKEIPNHDNTMYAIVNKENLIGFFEEVYFFIVDYRNIMDSLNFLEYHNDWTY